MELKPYKRIVTSGSFDLFHVGHLYLLERAKELGDYLIVLVSTNALIKKHKGVLPVVPFIERSIVVRALRCVDAIGEQSKLVDIKQFNDLDGDMFILGDDWKDRDDVPGIKWLKENNMILFLPYTNSVSSSVIKERIIKNADIILKAQKARERDK
jgi:glycerol-3-phosphate cytidylyltransferase